MASHIVTLFDRVPTASYPTSLTGAERPLYDAGRAYKYPLHARVVRAAGGAGSTIKIQGAPLSVNNCLFAIRGPGAQQGVLRIVALSGDNYRVRMTQRSGLSQAMTHSFASGLLTLNLPSDVNGGPAGTIDVTEAYIAANLSADFAASKSGVTSLGFLGATFGARPCGRDHWEDIVSTIGGLLPAAVEQTITPTAGSFSDVAIEINVRNYYAVRALAKSAGVPDPADRVTVLVTVDGA